jgi:hypothetical protein
MNGNGEAAAAVAPAPDAVAPQPIPGAPVKSYDDLFPSLPLSAPGGTSAGNAPIGGGQWNKKPMLASTTVTQVFRIPVEERKNFAFGTASDDGNNGMKRAIDRTGAKIEMSASKDQSLTFLISGKQDQVLRAKRELLTSFQTQANQVVAIPKEHHRFILGKGGARLQELEAKTATKISMPKVADASDKITISGTKEGIEKAIHEIRELDQSNLSAIWGKGFRDE